MSQVAEKASNGAPQRRLRSVEIAIGGVSTANQFAGLMSSLISEVLSGDLSPAVCNAAVNASGKLLKVVEMQHRYGVPAGDSMAKELVLYPPAATADPEAEARAAAAARAERIRRLEAELEAARATGPERRDA
jgi:hypothetical protein